MQIFGVKQGVGRAGWEILGGEGRQEQKQKSFFWVYFGCLVERRGCSAPRKLGVEEGGIAGFGAVKIRLGKQGDPTEPCCGWRFPHSPKGEGILLLEQVMLLQMIWEHPSLARVPPLQPDLWGFSLCLCVVVNPSGVGGCSKRNPVLFNPHLYPGPWGPILHRRCRSWVPALQPQLLPPRPPHGPVAALGRGWKRGAGSSSER